MNLNTKKAKVKEFRRKMLKIRHQYKTLDNLEIILIVRSHTYSKFQVFLTIYNLQ